MIEPTNRATRNKLFSTKPDVMYCGAYGGGDGCSDVPATLTCKPQREAEHFDAIQACPSEYKNLGLEYTKNCKNNLVINPRLRKCSKKTVDDPVFNILENEYKKAEGLTGAQGRTEAMMKKIRECCAGTTDDPRCGNLYYGDNNNEPLCKYDKRDYCLANLDNLSTDDCVEWCAKNRNACTTPIISGFCQDEKINPTDGKYDRVCGCYYKNEFYNKLQKELADKFQIPQEFLSGGRSCYFSGCNGSPLNPNPNEIKDKCKSISLSQCFQNLSLAAGGALYVDKDAVTQNIDCKTQITQTRKLYSKCTSKDDCASNFECINGQCMGNPATPPTTPPTTPPEVPKKDAGVACNFSSDCKQPLVCLEDSKKCGTEKASNLPLIIGLSVGGVVFLLIIIGFVFKMKSSSSSSTGTSS